MLEAFRRKWDNHLPDLLWSGFLHWAGGWTRWPYNPLPTQLFYDSVRNMWERGTLGQLPFLIALLMWRATEVKGSGENATAFHLSPNLQRKLPSSVPPLFTYATTHGPKLCGLCVVVQYKLLLMWLHNAYIAFLNSYLIIPLIGSHSMYLTWEAGGSSHL